jgi:hypothetical protein
VDFFLFFFAAVEFSIVAGHCGKPGRMSLVSGLKGKGAWLMLCVQGGRRQARTERRWNLAALPDTAASLAG